MTLCPKPEPRPKRQPKRLERKKPLVAHTRLAAASHRKLAEAQERGERIHSTLRAAQRQMRTKSAKTAAAMGAYIPERDAFLSENRWCEYPLGCGRPSVVLHHRWGRNGERLRDQEWWAASCDDHNIRAEDETGEARACKWLLDLNGVRPPMELGRAYLLALRHSRGDTA